MKYLLLGLLFNTSVFSATLDFNNVSLSGTGCPEGTTSTITSPDSKMLTILFDEFIAEVPQLDGDNDNGAIGLSRYDKFRSHKICYINIGANIPFGYKVESIEVSVDFRGMASVEAGAMAQFGSSITDVSGLNYYGRAKSIISSQVFRGGDEDLFVSKTKTIPINSSCSIQGNNHFKVSMQNVVAASVRRGQNPDFTSAFISLDSADMSGKLEVKLNISSCGYSYPRPNVPRRNPLPRNPRFPRNPRLPNIQCGYGMYYHPRIRRCVRRPRRASSQFDSYNSYTNYRNYGVTMDPQLELLLRLKGKI